MFLLRILVVLTVISLVVSLGAYLLTGQRRYLGYAWTVLRVAIIAGLSLFALLAVERLLVVPL